MRNILIALLFLLWLILGWLYYQDYHRCCNQQENSEVLPAKIIDSGPILFSIDDSIPKLGEGWSRMKDSLALFASENSILEISAMYCDSVLYSESKSLGMARAREIRKLFPDIPEDRIVLVSRSMRCDSNYNKANFKAGIFVRRMMTESIKETNESTLIYFPFNSTQKLNSSSVESYLDDVAERVKQSGETVLLTGHTDNIGSEKSNIDLGMKRARIVEEYLLSKGIAKNKIKSSSKGESEPIEDNTTESGRNKNRRTALQIIK